MTVWWRALMVEGVSETKPGPGTCRGGRAGQRERARSRVLVVLAAATGEPARSRTEGPDESSRQRSSAAATVPGALAESVFFSPLDPKLEFCTGHGRPMSVSAMGCDIYVCQQGGSHEPAARGCFICALYRLPTLEEHLVWGSKSEIAGMMRVLRSPRKQSPSHTPPLPSPPPPLPTRCLHHHTHAPPPRQPLQAPNKITKYAGFSPFNPSTLARPPVHPNAVPYLVSVWVFCTPSCLVRHRCLSRAFRLLLCLPCCDQGKDQEAYKTAAACCCSVTYQLFSSSSLDLPLFPHFTVQGLLPSLSSDLIRSYRHP